MTDTCPIHVDKWLFDMYKIIADHHGITAQSLMQDVLHKCFEDEFQAAHKKLLNDARAAKARIQKLTNTRTIHVV